MEHLSEAELEEFFSSIVSNRGGSALPPRMEAHCQECPACAALLDTHTAVAKDINSLDRFENRSNGHNCPDQERWLELMAGLLEPSEAHHLLGLAVECKNCAERLRTAQTYLAEDKPLPALGSSDPQWQRRLVLKIRSAPPAKKSKRNIWLLYALPAATAACIVVVAVFWFIRTHNQRDIGRLLAKAYEEDRRIEARIPGVPYAQLHQQRSATHQSSASKTPYDEADEAVKSLCSRAPDSQDCALWAAKLDAIERNYDPVISSLSPSKEGPGSVDGPLFRGIAELGKADEEDGSVAQVFFARAIEDFSKVLARNPGDPAALFNRGLAYQKQNMVDLAIADFRQLLNIENDPGWREEVRSKLENLKKKKLRE